MLGAWATTKSHSKVLEVGSGTGIVSLMLRQKEPTIQILAIDRSQYAIDLTRTNFQNSPWADRLKTQMEDFRSPSGELLTHKFDHIVSNPPFFKNGLLPSSALDQNARHSVGIHLSELIMQSSILLEPEGTLQMILPFDRMKELQYLLEENNMHLYRLTTVKAKLNKAPYRMLVEVVKQSTTPQFTSITMYTSEGSYSSDYKKLLATYMTIF